MESAAVFSLLAVSCMAVLSCTPAADQSGTPATERPAEPWTLEDVTRRPPTTASAS